eukprot:2789790-Amphidinium_carterae.1
MVSKKKKKRKRKRKKKKKKLLSWTHSCNVAILDSKWRRGVVSSALGRGVESKRLGVHALVFTGGLEEADMRLAAEGAVTSGYGQDHGQDS